MVSCSTKTLPELQDNQTFKTDFMNCEIEHIIKDSKADGYEPGKLTYVFNQKILIACSSNRRVVAWTINDDSTNIVDEFQVDEAIRCCKTVDVDESTTLLLLGGKMDILIYEIKERKFSFKQKLECGYYLLELEVNVNQHKLYVAKSEYHIQVYNLLNFSLEEKIDISQYGFKDLGRIIQRLIYMEKENALAIEDFFGLLIVSLGEGKSLLNSFRCFGRTETGVCYLPKSDKFLFRTGNLGISILDAKTLTVIASCKNLLCGNGAPFRFIANEDESQIIGNMNYVNFVVYEPDLLGYSKFHLSNHVIKTGAVEVLKGQKRFAVGDMKSGTIVILKSNSDGPDTIKPSTGLFVPDKAVKQSMNKKIESEKKDEKATKMKEVKSSSTASKRKTVSKKAKAFPESDEEVETNEKKNCRGRRQVSEERKEKKQKSSSKERSKEKATKKSSQKSKTKQAMKH